MEHIEDYSDDESDIENKEDINDINDEYLYELIFEYIKKKLDNLKTDYHFELCEFKFGDLKICIKFHIKSIMNKPENEQIMVGCFVPDYEQEGMLKEVFWHEFDEYNAKLITNFLFAFRTCYAYSKILDEIVEKKDLEKQEKTVVALTKFCKQEKIEKCCVCYDFNVAKTICGHNLCRVCFQNIKLISNDEEDFKYKECPLCRNCLIF